VPRVPHVPRGIHAAAALREEARLVLPEDDLLSVDTAERDAILDGLRKRPVPSISCVYLYDKLGSELFEQICDTPEYYLTRTEDALLRAITPDLLLFTGEADERQGVSPTTWVECSAGNGHKVAPLVLNSAGVRPTTYVPMDVSASALEVNTRRFAAMPQSAHPLHVQALVGTDEEGLAEAAARFAGRKSFLFLGSSLGNYDVPEDQLRLLARHMEPEDRLLIGVDTPPSALSGGKTEQDLVAAYNDAAGVTSAFTLNALAHVNRRADLDFDLADFRHVSEWCAERQAIVAHVVAVRDVIVNTHMDGEVEEVLSLRAGERIYMEQSAKFSLARMRSIAHAAGLRITRHWQAPREFYLIVECERVL